MTKEEIKENIDVSSVLSEYGVEVRRGMCRCPFHDDHRPSMRVYKDKAVCFTCANSWDVFDIVMSMDGVTFKEAFKRLGGHFETDKDAEYFREIRTNLRGKQPNDEHKQLFRAIAICQNADALHDWGSPQWHRLKELELYFWELWEEGMYDWRMVEKINAQYAGVNVTDQRERLEDEYRMELVVSSIKEVPKNGIST